MLPFQPIYHKVKFSDSQFFVSLLNLFSGDWYPKRFDLKIEKLRQVPLGFTVRSHVFLGTHFHTVLSKLTSHSRAVFSSPPGAGTTLGVCIQTPRAAPVVTQTIHRTQDPCSWPLPLRQEEKTASPRAGLSPFFLIVWFLSDLGVCSLQRVIAVVELIPILDSGVFLFS